MSSIRSSPPRMSSGRWAWGARTCWHLPLLPSRNLYSPGVSKQRGAVLKAVHPGHSEGVAPPEAAGYPRWGHAHGHEQRTWALHGWIFFYYLVAADRHSFYQSIRAIFHSLETSVSQLFQIISACGCFCIAVTPPGVSEDRS